MLVSESMYPGQRKQQGSWAGSDSECFWKNVQWLEQ